MTRLAHVSDVHVAIARPGWSMRDVFSKRTTSWLNLKLAGRGRRFAQAEPILNAFRADVQERGSHVVFSGDATALGFPSEIRRAAELFYVEHLPGLAVPGNHDYCTRRAEQCGVFEHAFAPWLKGERVDDHIYPFAQNAGGYWLVAVNSARGNRLFWDASGGVDAAQCARLRRLFEQLPAGPRILVTHYPIARHDGRPERGAHGLVNLPQVLEIARAGGVALWLHGHRHGFYVLREPAGAGFPAICAGSATETGCVSYGEYTLTGTHLSGARREYDSHVKAFREAEQFELQLG